MNITAERIIPNAIQEDETTQERLLIATLGLILTRHFIKPTVNEPLEVFVYPLTILFIFFMISTMTILIINHGVLNKTP